MSEERIKKKKYGDLEIEIIEEDDVDIETLACNKCKEILQIPHQSPNCAHLNCKKCLEAKDTCPCGVKGPQYLDHGVLRVVRNLCIKCPFGGHSGGTCPWKGNLQYIEEHKNDCKEAPVQCVNDGCTVQMNKAALEEHLKECRFVKIKCENCNESVILAKMEEHYVTCPKTTIVCEKCEETMPRCEKEDHVHPVFGLCTKTEGRCPFAEFGCPMHKVMEGQVRVEHLANNEAAHQTFTVDALRTALKGCKKCETLEKKLHDLQQEQDGMRKEMNRMDKQLKAMSKTQTKSQDVQNVCDRMQEELKNMQRMEMFVSRSDYEQLLERMRKLLEVFHLRKDVLTSTFTGPVEREVQFYELKSKLQKIECVTMNGNGTFTWVIDSLAKRREEAIERKTAMNSAPFYASPEGGYKMCIRAYLNGEGEGTTTHLGIFVVLMKGVYDSLQKWPFRRHMTLSVLDQNPTSRNAKNDIVVTFKPDNSASFYRPKKEMNPGNGFPLFCPLGQILNKANNFVQDDCLFIRLKVHDDIA